MPKKIKTVTQMKAELKRLTRNASKGRLILRATITHPDEKTQYSRKTKHKQRIKVDE